jgi:hypothetical protein
MHPSEGASALVERHTALYQAIAQTVFRKLTLTPSAREKTALIMVFLDLYFEYTL